MYTVAGLHFSLILQTYLNTLQSVNIQMKEVPICLKTKVCGTVTKFAVCLL